jgi:DNA methyltransferase 1-associated protein 1
MTRKKYISSLENRTADQIAEEEALYIEIKRLEQNERRFRRERDDLLRTLAGVDSGLPDLPVDEEGLSFVGSGMGNGGYFWESRKRRKGNYDLDSPSTPSGIIALGPPIAKRPPAERNAQHGTCPTPVLAIAVKAYTNLLTSHTHTDALHCITRHELPGPSTPATKATHQPVYLRSLKLPQPKASLASKVTLALAELGVQHTRLVMPTRENCARLEKLLDAATQLVETKKIVDKIDQDIKVMKARLGMRVSEASEGAANNVGEGSGPMESAGAGEEDGEDGTPMDVDAEGEPDDEGAPSVISTRSGRSRRNVSAVSCSAFVSFIRRVGPDAALELCIISGDVCNGLYSCRDKAAETRMILTSSRDESIGIAEEGF